MSTPPTMIAIPPPKSTCPGLVRAKMPSRAARSGSRLCRTASQARPASKMTTPADTTQGESDMSFCARLRMSSSPSRSVTVFPLVLDHGGPGAWILREDSGSRWLTRGKARPTFQIRLRALSNAVDSRATIRFSTAARREAMAIARLGQDPLTPDELMDALEQVRSDYTGGNPAEA